MAKITYSKPGVYQIKCLYTGKVYIGSTKNLSKRFSLHKSQLTHGRHDNPNLQNAYNMGGLDGLQFDVLILLREYNRDLLHNLEDEFLAKNRDKLLNVAPLARSNYGVKRREETKLKISESLMQYNLEKKIANLNNLPQLSLF